MNIKNIVITYFNVKSGENRGFYLAIENASKENQLEILKSVAVQLGCLNMSENYDFYKRHGIKNGLIWTHSGFAGYDYYAVKFNDYLDRLKEKGYTVKIKK